MKDVVPQSTDRRQSLNDRKERESERHYQRYSLRSQNDFRLKSKIIIGWKYFIQRLNVILLTTVTLARLNYEKSWKKGKNLGKILLSTKKSWPTIKEKLGVFARSIGQEFFCKSLGPRLFQKKRDKV
jgi:hypothetical protein